LRERIILTVLCAMLLTVLVVPVGTAENVDLIIGYADQVGDVLNETMTYLSFPAINTTGPVYCEQVIMVNNTGTDNYQYWEFQLGTFTGAGHSFDTGQDIFLDVYLGSQYQTSVYPQTNGAISFQYSLAGGAVAYLRVGVDFHEMPPADNYTSSFVLWIGTEPYTEPTRAQEDDHTGEATLQVGDGINFDVTYTLANLGYTGITWEVQPNDTELQAVNVMEITNTGNLDIWSVQPIWAGLANTYWKYTSNETQSSYSWANNIVWQLWDGADWFGPNQTIPQSDDWAEHIPPGGTGYIIFWSTNLDTAPYDSLEYEGLVQCKKPGEPWFPKDARWELEKTGQYQHTFTYSSGSSLIFGPVSRDATDFRTENHLSIVRNPNNDFTTDNLMLSIDSDFWPNVLAPGGVWEITNGSGDVKLNVTIPASGVLDVDLIANGLQLNDTMDTLHLYLWVDSIPASMPDAQYTAEYSIKAHTNPSQVFIGSIGGSTWETDNPLDVTVEYTPTTVIENRSVTFTATYETLGGLFNLSKVEWVVYKVTAGGDEAIDTHTSNDTNVWGYTFADKGKYKVVAVVTGKLGPANMSGADMVNVTVAEETETTTTTEEGWLGINWPWSLPVIDTQTWRWLALIGIIASISLGVTGIYLRKKEG